MVDPKPTADNPSAPSAKSVAKAGRRRRRKASNPRSIKNLPTWLLVALAWLVARLPLRVVFRLGDLVGTLLYAMGNSRRNITLTNLKHCFPELDENAREKMARQVFKEISIGALELMIPWLNPKRDLSARFNITGQQHLDAAVAEGRGVILVGAHYAVMDVICQPLSQCGPIDVMYRYNKNPVWEWLQVSGRARYFDGVIERGDTRQVLRRLKQGRVIWYAADQDYGAKHSVFASFFGMQAATIVATSRFARLNKSPVLILRQTRDRQRGGWDLQFSPVIDNFPSGDEQTDAERLNGLLEAEIRLHPEQYLWLHKRFKTRPPDSASIYS